MRLLLFFIFAACLGCSKRGVTPVEPIDPPTRAQTVNLNPASEATIKIGRDVREAADDIGEIGGKTVGAKDKITLTEDALNEIYLEVTEKSRKKIEEALFLLSETKESLRLIVLQLASTREKLKAVGVDNEGLRLSLSEQKENIMEQEFEINQLRKDNKVMREGLEAARENVIVLQETQRSLDKVNSKKNLYRNIVFGCVSAVGLYFAAPLLLRLIKPI